MMAMAPPMPKSTPDPCGRNRLQHAVDTLHREIGFLEGEINSIEGVHAASRCCKEVDEFVVQNADPFITISSKKGNSDQSHHLSKKFRVRKCLRRYLSWMICCHGGGCSSFRHKRGLPPCSSCGTLLERLCRRCACRRLRCACPRCSCGCACSCPRCSCDAACCCCVLPRCCHCL